MEQTVNIPVQMLCYVSTQGEFTPIHFRFEDDEHHLLTVDVTKILTHKTTSFNGIKEIHYICKAPIGEKEVMFDLKYTVESHKWVIFKLLD
jgi:hypothetical protein